MGSLALPPGPTFMHRDGLDHITEVLTDLLPVDFPDPKIQRTPAIARRWPDEVHYKQRLEISQHVVEWEILLSNQHGSHVGLSF